MHSTAAQETFVCIRCLARGAERSTRARKYNAARSLHTSPRRLAESGGKNAFAEEQAQQGAMSRRLQEMTEQSLEEGGRSARKAVQEAGFSEELKSQLEARIKDDKSRKLDPTASAALSMPVGALNDRVQWTMC